MPAKKRMGHADRKPTRYRGVYYRGSGEGRRYEITWRCFGTCDNPKHVAKGAGQHWQRAHGDASDAVKLLARIEDEIEERRARVQRGERIAPERTFIEVMEEYKRSPAWKDLAPSTRPTYERHLRNNVLPGFGPLLVRQIDKQRITGWLRDLRQGERKRRRGDRTHGLSESSINGALTALRVVLLHAKDEGYIDRNPVDELSKRAKPKVTADKRDVRVLDEAELERLFGAAEAPYPLMLKLKAYTGLRSSELRGLVWGDLDLDAGRVTVSTQIDHAERGERVPLKSKTLTDRRSVPLMTELSDELRDHRAKLAEWGRAKPAAWVFPNEDGGHITYPAFAAAFARAVEAAGLGPDETLTPHSLRHGFGSMMLAGGDALMTVSNWLGHTRVSTTERWYAHQIAAMQDEASERMRARMDERRAQRLDLAGSTS
ncbi:MAG: tyrosine-type recombinase/integrase [Thermoleophilaceae bacterium]|nr:tyrosine-type recombinase/integrase [Thermoleophilaceae bacterium]